MSKLRFASILLIVSAALPASAADKDFDVGFTDCAEYVGIGFVPSAQARPFVPAGYTLAVPDGTNAVIVVRIATCGAVQVDGKNARAARTAQIGIMLAGLDPTASINNYLLWYVTDHGQLHGKLTAIGLKCGNDQQLSFVFGPQGGAGPLSSEVDAAQSPAYFVDGDAVVPTSAPVTFVANWWQDGGKGTVRMRSTFPAIRFSDATVTLTTAASTELATLIGGTSMEFAILDSYNTFPAAAMEVRAQ